MEKERIENELVTTKDQISPFKKKLLLVGSLILAIAYSIIKTLLK